MNRVAELSTRLASSRYRRKTLADGTGIVLDADGMRVLSLNRTGMFVLEEIVGGATDRELLERRIVETFEIDGETAARDLSELVDELERLLTAPSEP